MSWYDNVFLAPPDDDEEERIDNEDDFVEPDDFEPYDDDCDYWKSNCYGRG